MIKLYHGSTVEMSVTEIYYVLFELKCKRHRMYRKKQYRDAATATPLHYLKKTNHTFIIFPLTITWVSAPSRRSMCVPLLLTSTFRTLSLWRIWNE